MGQTLKPIHFGEHLTRLMREQDVTVTQLAEAMNYPASLLRQLIAGEQILTGDLALLLADLFGVSPLALLQVQRDYWLAVKEGVTEKQVLAA